MSLQDAMSEAMDRFEAGVAADNAAADAIRIVKVKVVEYVKETFEVEIELPEGMPDPTEEGGDQFSLSDEHYDQLAALVEAARVQADDLARNIEVTEVVWDVVEGRGDENQDE